jgi:uncharacterized protein YdhG (YjbR/CyaY superfamily)
MKGSIQNTGAVMMGRNSFDMAEDPDLIAGNYEYQVPIFVLTHRPPKRHPKETDLLTFTFVMDGIENAIAQAKAAAPKAEETISYDIPTFKMNGKYLIYFADWKQHISIYPIPAGDAAFRKEIEPYVSGRGTLKFPLDKPIPFKLITQMVKLQIAENLEKTGYRSKGDKK